MKAFSGDQRGIMHIHEFVLLSLQAYPPAVRRFYFYADCDVKPCQYFSQINNMNIF